MRILVLGAGAVGGYFGGRLAEAGADVTFLVRERRAAELARDGLAIRSPHGDLRLAPKLHRAGEPLPRFDLLLLCCKAYDLEAAMVALAPAVGEGSRLLPLLNGLAHLDRLAGRFGAERVLGGVCHIAATLSPEGEIRHLNRLHALQFGARGGRSDPALLAIAAALAGAGFEARRVDAIDRALWEKFVMLATLAGMSCLMRADVGAIMATEDGRRLMLELLAECAAIARAAGEPPRPEMIERTRAMLTEPGSRFAASMLRDIERGGPTEGEHILGDLRRRGEALGVEAPLLRVAHCHLQAYEARRLGAPPSPAEGC